MADDNDMMPDTPFPEPMDSRWVPESAYPEPENIVRIGATPFAAWQPEDQLPVRRWLYGHHLIRGRVSLDVAAGGVGKTALKVGEAVAMAAGRDLFNKAMPEGALRVWLYNLEDDADELTIRLRAALKYHRVSRDEINDRLFVDSGLDQPCIVARQTGPGTTIAVPLVDALIAEIRARKIDVLILDPFVSSHGVPENDNGAIDLVVKQAFVRIAHECQCAINLVHHIRKSNGEEATADSARGASALIGAARSVQVFNRMTEDEAAKADVVPEKRKFYFRVTNEKANMAPPPERADWYRMNSVDLDNGEQVGVAAQFLWPAEKQIEDDKIEAIRAAMAGGQWRESPQATDWVGHAIGHILGFNSRDKAEAKKVQTAIRQLVKNEFLVIVSRDDGKGRMKPFVEQNQ